MRATLPVTLRDIALFLALMLSGCAAPTTAPRTITSTPDFTATPPPTPTPAQALNPDALWIASDAPSRQVIVASPDGDVTSISLPLNEGQTASEMAASPDGQRLAYIVWNSDTEQYGIAMWNLAEPFARLIVQPLPGYGIVSLMFSADSETLLYVQMDSPSSWRLESIPVGGGQSAVLADNQSAPEMEQVEPFAWQTGHPVYFTTYMPRDGSPTGFAYEIYSLETTTGLTTRLTSDGDWVLPPPALSPDGMRLAFVAGSPEEIGVWSVKVMDLSVGSAVTIPHPDGGTMISLAWQADSQHLLLDMLTGSGEQSSQTFALVDVESAASPQTSLITPTTPLTPSAERSSGGGWPQLPADPDREHLINYLPYGDGVAYTILPEADGDPWTLTLFEEIGSDAVPVVIPLGRPDAGAPRILRVPIQ